MSVDSRDVAAAASVVLASEGHSGKTYNLVGPNVPRSTDYAANWADALTREVEYNLDIKAWKQSVPYLPTWLAYDLGMMYEDYSRNGMLGTEEDIDRVTDLLGRPPRSHRQFAQELAVEWLAVGP